MFFDGEVSSRIEVALFWINLISLFKTKTKMIMLCPYIVYFFINLNVYVTLVNKEFQRAFNSR